MSLSLAFPHQNSKYISPLLVPLPQIFQICILHIDCSCHLIVTRGISRGIELRAVLPREILTPAKNSRRFHVVSHASAIGHSCINSYRCRTTGLRRNKSFCGDPGDICAGNGMQIHVRSDILAALTDIWNRVRIERYGTSGRLPLRAPELSLLKLSRGADPSWLVCNSGLCATGCELFNVTSGAQAS